MTNKDKGELVEQIVITEFLKLGIPVSKTLGDNQPYDIIIDIKGSLYKVQIRTCWKLKNTLKISFQSSRRNSKISYKTTNKNKVDMYVAYCFENEKCYLIDVNKTNNINSICLQLNDNCKNGKVLNFAKDFELKTMVHVVLIGKTFGC